MGRKSRLHTIFHVVGMTYRYGCHDIIPVIMKFSIIQWPRNYAELPGLKITFAKNLDFHHLHPVAKVANSCIGERVEGQRTDSGDDEQCAGQTSRHHSQARPGTPSQHKHYDREIDALA